MIYLGYLNKKDSVKILMLKYRREMITVEVPKETQGDESLVSGRGVSLRGRWAQASLRQFHSGDLSHCLGQSSRLIPLVVGFQ